MKSDLVDIELDFRHETDGAYAVWNGEKDGRTGREKWVWLSKSYTERDGNTFMLPERIALEKGLI